jgi:hypothetical protein
MIRVGSGRGVLNREKISANLGMTKVIRTAEAMTNDKITILG